MRRVTLVLAVAAIMAVLSPGIAHADTAVVPAFVCAELSGGNATVSAGSQVVVAQRWEAKSRGLVQTFLNAQTTTISVNGSEPVDLSGDYDPIAPTSDGARNFTRVLYDTGVTLSAGESMRFDLVISLSHRLHAGLTLADGDSHKPLFFGPGETFEFGCTVTAV
jgi:hypothetical protein